MKAPELVHEALDMRLSPGLADALGFNYVNFSTSALSRTVRSKVEMSTFVQDLQMASRYWYEEVEKIQNLTTGLAALA